MPFPDKGILHSAKKVDSAMTALARRSLADFALPAVLRKEHRGIGCHGFLGGGGAGLPSRLLPHQVTSFRKVRLLRRRAETDNVWREQISFMRSVDLSALNSALVFIKPYREIPNTKRKRETPR